MPQLFKRYWKSLLVWAAIANAVGFIAIRAFDPFTCYFTGICLGFLMAVYYAAILERDDESA